MLETADAYATIPVKNLEEARQFYEQTLGLTVDKEDIGGVTYKSGNSKLYVYSSDFAGTNQATALSWEVDDVRKVAAALNERGVAFEHYDDLLGVTREGDIHKMNGTMAVWFKDPTGNILAVASTA